MAATKPSKTSLELKKLQQENEELRCKLAEAEDTISAIQSGAVDALVINGPRGNQIFSLEGADYTYRVLVDSMLEGAATISTAYDIAYCNRRLSNMLECPFDKILGKPVTDFIHKDDLNLFKSIIKTMSASANHSCIGEVRLLKASGKTVPVLLSCNMLDVEGMFACLIFTNLTEIKTVQNELKSMNENLDILVQNKTKELQQTNFLLKSEILFRKKAEEDLKQSESRFRTIAESLPVYISIGTLNDSKILYLNEAYNKAFGFKKGEMTGQNAPDLYIDPAERDAMVDVLKKQGSLINYEIQVKKADGTPFWISSSVKQITFEGKPAMLGASIDITERKQAEEDLKQTREKLEIALENGNIGVWEWNLVNGESKWDERMEKMFGIDPGSFGGTFSDFENLVHEEDMPHVQRAINRAVGSNLPYETVFRTRIRDGKVKYISTKAVVTRDSQKKPVSMSGVCFDVTGMKEGTEKVLLKLNEELLRSNKELQSFAYVASHDLQEPLRMVSSFTQLLQHRYADKLDQNANEFIKYAVDGANRMHELINGLLDYSRIQTKGEQFTFVSMPDVLRIVSKNIEMAIEETKATITSDPLPTVFADKLQMVQVIQNLVGNAVKFSQNNPIIHLSCKKENGWYIFSVKDNGIGIELPYYEKIFQIFQRLNTREEFSGTGIGLAICRRIIERHNGKIWVESEPGKGTTFYFTLPVIEDIKEDDITS